jgi:serine/threonine-protein kinase HipA
LPEDVVPEPAGVIDGTPVDDDEIAKIIANLARSPLGLEKDSEFRISIAGAQEKTALLRYSGKWLRPNGTTPTTHILKPQIGQLPNGIDLSNSVENEFFCLTLTKAMGLPSAAVEIATFGDKPVLVVERFDRLFTDNGRLLRIPQEDCCQALSIPWTTKYENEGGPGIQQIMGLLVGSDDALADRQRFLKEIIVFWLLAATDGHAKNFSIRLYPGGGYGLTPLYDVLSAQPSFGAKQIARNKLKLAMAVGDSRHYVIDKITGRHFVQSAEKAGLGRESALAVIDDVLKCGPAAMKATLEALPSTFPAAVAEPISKVFFLRLSELQRSRDIIG